MPPTVPFRGQRVPLSRIRRTWRRITLCISSSSSSNNFSSSSNNSSSCLRSRSSRWCSKRRIVVGDKIVGRSSAHRISALLLSRRTGSASGCLLPPPPPQTPRTSPRDLMRRGALQDLTRATAHRTTFCPEWSMMQRSAAAKGQAAGHCLRQNPVGTTCRRSNASGREKRIGQLVVLLHAIICTAPRPPKRRLTLGPGPTSTMLGKAPPGAPTRIARKKTSNSPSYRASLMNPSGPAVMVSRMVALAAGAEAGQGPCNGPPGPNSRRPKIAGTAFTTATPRTGISPTR
mmetsp:Transcript_110881/g.318539  ORF Transcript_110881/g.318539 Transcript_110881/m.318539 type:complete len:288 (-) Transcript_110881:631-1494(-)